MRLIIDNEITIQNASSAEKSAIKDWLTIANPQYLQNEKMGFSNYKTPRNLYFYKELGNNLVVPTGLLNKLLNNFNCDMDDKRVTSLKSEYVSKIKLYDYQKEVVDTCINIDRVSDVRWQFLSGVIVMSAGSGKTQTALELIHQLGLKTLWLTHTQDLLNQSYQRAKDNLSAGLGKISAGKIQVGEHITFATVQTMCKLDLSEYANMFDVVVIDECHRVVGTPIATGMFYKVISSLSAKYKIGLTATPYRAAKGTELAMFSLLGDIIIEVDKSVVKTVKAKIKRINYDYELGENSFNSDGTINFSGMLTELGQDIERNDTIVQLLKENVDRNVLVLSDRLEQLMQIRDKLGYGVMIHGKMTSKSGKAEREKAIEDMRQGKEKVLFASYSLAKEGLDIPRLDCLVLATPKKDKATIIQSVGRVERVFEGKKEPIVYDIVDKERLHESMWAVRKRIYKANGNELV